MELYVHIPFCRKKCRYCAFTSFPEQEASFRKYIQLLHQEALIRCPEATEPIRTVYIGGGTPSILPSALFSELTDHLRSVFDLDEVEEYTSEANPGTATREWLDSAVSHGVNRISFGMQAYQGRLLQLLGRIHTSEDVFSSVSLARSSGIHNISLDLIFGIPTQSLKDWEETVRAALSMKPQHISAYGLIPEEGTPLKDDLDHGRLILPEPELEREMYDMVIRLTEEAGFHQYEISSFAQKSYECRHNIGYWTQVPYIGLGISAASMTGVRYGTDGMSYTRSVNPDSFSDYQKLVSRRSFPANRDWISPAEARFETMMLGLRMNKGVSESAFLRMHRIPVEQCYGEKLRSMEKKGLFVHEDGIWRLTERGFDIQNSILVEMMDR